MSNRIEQNRMRVDYIRFGLPLLAALAVLAAGGCKPQKPAKVAAAEDNSTVDAEPLLLEDEPLLLEDEPLLLAEEPPLLLTEDDPAASPQGEMADNSRCHVCHLNYAAEDIAVDHARAGIGCSGCHGESDAHIADESWAMGGNGTAPDIMYPRQDINPKCMSCHTRDAIDTPQHEGLFSAMDEKVCTDCHGDHRLNRRKCKWK